MDVKIIYLVLNLLLLVANVLFFFIYLPIHLRKTKKNIEKLRRVSSTVSQSEKEISELIREVVEIKENLKQVRTINN